MSEQYTVIGMENKGDGIVVLKLNRPPVNALNRKVFEELQKALDELRRERQCRVLIVAGEGEHFAAGADIKEFAKLIEARQFEVSSAFAGHTFDLIEVMPFPVIAAIDGFCLGGGNELAMACHIRIAGPTATFGQPEIKLGLIPGYGGTQRLKILVGRSRALRLMLTGERIGAAEAYRIGLVDQLAEEGSTALETALAVGRTIASHSDEAIARILQVTAPDEDFTDGVHREREAFGKCGESVNGREGVRAFIEKRPARFQRSDG